MTGEITYSLVIPVYRNEAFLPELVRTVEGIAANVTGRMEAVFVIDGSPDRSEEWLLTHLSACAVPAQLVAQLLWIGFDRAEVSYIRRARAHGESGWTLRKKLRYLFDRIFSFTDIPITILTLLGFAGTFFFLPLGAALLALRIAGVIEVQGYTAIMVAILFSASLILLGLGIVGNYVWRTYENTKRRPLGVIRAQRDISGAKPARDDHGR